MKTPKQIRNEEPTGYRRGFIDGHKEAEKSIKEMIERLKDKDFIMSILQEDVTIDVEEGMKFIDIDGVRNKIDKQILSKIGEEKQDE